MNRIFSMLNRQVVNPLDLTIIFSTDEIDAFNFRMIDVGGEEYTDILILFPYIGKGCSPEFKVYPVIL